MNPNTKTAVRDAMVESLIQQARTTLKLLDTDQELITGLGIVEVIKKLRRPEVAARLDAEKLERVREEQFWGEQRATS